MNGTILSSDTILGLSPAQLLLDAMCGIVQVQPKEAFDYTWPGQATSVRLEKSQTLRKLMSQLSCGTAELSNLFTTREGCESLMHALEGRVAFQWNQGEDLNSPQDLLDEYDKYMVQVANQEHFGYR